MSSIFSFFLTGCLVVLELSLSANLHGAMGYLRLSLPVVLFVAALFDLNSTLRFTLVLVGWYLLLGAQTSPVVIIIWLLVAVLAHLTYNSIFSKLTLAPTVVLTLLGSICLIALSELTDYLMLLKDEAPFNLLEIFWGWFWLNLETGLILYVIAKLHYRYIQRFKDLFLKASARNQ
ncbi:MAG: hypothetical protein V1821_02285 [bacterium]